MKTIFYFTAEWCGPCRNTRPIIEQMNRDGYAKFQFIDIDYEQDLAKKFHIRSVPTFILFEDNKEVRRIIGAQNKQSMEKFING